jgi:phenylpropionate dioxygenase-like ring-hydroxylating dioxygenase large terminal subunit
MNVIDKGISPPKDWDRRGLPGWTYHSEALLDLERKHLFRTHWQIVCHTSDIPTPGSYQTFDAFGERALVVHGDDGKISAFQNICRHRGSRLVVADNGICKGALICPFHGWVYNFDGTLRGAAQPKSFPDLDKNDFGLMTIECEVWNGLIFIRFADGPQPSVSELMAPFSEEISQYQMNTLVPTSGLHTNTSPVNWKSIRDVDNEGYHVAMAHPALQDLYGKSYHDEPFQNGLSRSVGIFNRDHGRHWSVRHYSKLSTPQEDLPKELHETWLYWALFPNTVIAATPESVQFYQEFPISTDKSLLRGAVYKYENETRQQKAARYLAERIDRETFEEDVQLTIWSNEAMASRDYAGFYLSDLEYGVRTHHDHIRAVLPVVTLEDAPTEDNIAWTNDEMIAKLAN